MKLRPVSIGFFLVFFLPPLGFYLKFVCHGIGCIENKEMKNVCLQDDDYFFTGKNFLFEDFFYYPWFFKTTIYPKRYLYVVSYEPRVINMIPFKFYKERTEIIEISRCVEIFDFSKGVIK